MKTKILSKKLKEMKPDFGYWSPKRTVGECSNPSFYDHNLHRVAVMKVNHLGNKGDVEETGIPGWTTKLVCTQCKREFKHSWFYPDTLRMK